MRELIKPLYIVAGSYGKRITKMLIFDVIKGIFEGVSLMAILLSLMKLGESVFHGRMIVMADIYSVIGIAVLSVVGKIIFGHLADRNKYIASYSLGAENRIYIGDRLKNVNMGFFSENSLGTVAGGLSTVIGELETVGVFIIEQLLVGTIQTLIMVAFLLPFDLITGGIILGTLIVSLLVNMAAQKKADSLTEQLLGLKLDLNTKVLEYVKGIGVTKAFGKEKNRATELKESIDKSKKGFLAVEKLLVPTQLSFLSVFKIGVAVIIFTSLMRFINGDIDGIKAIMLIIASFVVFSGFELAGSMRSIKGIAVQNLNTVMKLRNLPIVEEGDKKEIEKAEVNIENIHFSYDQTELFKDFSLVIPEGKTTALVGPSGSGKTTLCSLMARFWDVEEGRITIDDSEIREYQYDGLLSNFSFVFQDVYLFDDTIRNNIAFGNPNATDEEIKAVAKKAQCHEFIMELPEGYDTVLQEGGSNLSGGERQRISIARAMLKPNKIVILDEATSSIDPENERELLTALKNLLKGKTVVIIAHKLSTARNADQIVVLDRGKIKQKGTHKELLQEEGIYKDFIEGKKKIDSWTVG